MWHSLVFIINLLLGKGCLGVLFQGVAYPREGVHLLGTAGWHGELIAAERTSRVRKTWLCSSSWLTRLTNSLPIWVKDTRDKQGRHLMDLPIPWAMGSSFSFFHPYFNKETPHSSSWLIHSCEYTVTLKFIIPYWPPLSFCPLSLPAVLWEHTVFPGHTLCASYRYLPAYNHPIGNSFILWHWSAGWFSRTSFSQTSVTRNTIRFFLSPTITLVLLFYDFIHKQWRNNYTDCEALSLMTLSF